MYYQLVPLAHPTEEIESGLLHTPSGQEPGVTTERLVTKDGEPAKIGERAYDKDTGRLAQVGLTQQLGMIPTPSATPRGAHTGKESGSVSEDGKTRTAADGTKWGATLQTKIHQAGLLPTPNTMESLEPKSRESIIAYNQKSRLGRSYATTNLRERIAYGKMSLLPTPTGQEVAHPEAELNEKNRRVSANENSHSLNIADRISMLPTPAATEARQGYQDRTRGKKGSQESLTTVLKNETGGKKTGMKLQPGFVEWMMGYRIGSLKLIEESSPKPLKPLAEKKLRDRLDLIAQKLILGGQSSLKHWVTQ